MFNFVAVKENYTQMKDVVRLAADIGVPFVTLRRWN